MPSLVIFKSKRCTLPSGKTSKVNFKFLCGLFVVDYHTKKTPSFLPNHDKLPDSYKANAVYEFSCPGCGHSYIGKLNVLWKRDFLNILASTLTKLAQSHNTCLTVVTLFT